VKPWKSVSPLALGLLASGPALGHVKWFVEFDVSESPRYLPEVLGPNFWWLLLAASVALFFTFLIDIKWSRSMRFDWIGRLFDSHHDLVTNMVRIGTGVFFVTLWLIGDVILTPELSSDAAFIGYLHFFTALFVLFESTLILSALGILALYGFGVMEYGYYHMIDYVLFLGLAVYLALSSLGAEGLKRHRLPLLVIAMLFSFLWSAIEKFGYPHWFDPFLNDNEFLTMGLPRDIFLMCAAFVEFTLVYVLLTGRNMVVLGALALNLLIIAGALYFGKIDTIGHFLIIVILAIIAIRGPSTYRFLSYRKGLGTISQAGLMVLGYWSSLALMFTLYYGVHRLAYG